jgi:UDP-glucose 4-epimerase
MRILVTGGTGYIGSHTVLSLQEAGHEVVVVDNLVNSSEESLRRVAERGGRTLAHRPAAVLQPGRRPPPSGRIGEDPQGIPNNLVPFIAQVAVGRREKLMVFGGDYDTPDGTCQRDYIHVVDLAEGHAAALKHVAGRAGVFRWNLGSGKGSSVLEVLSSFEKAVGRPLPYEVTERRAGDLPAFWADASSALADLGWSTTKTVDEMCEDHWRWQKHNPQGY